MFDFRGKEYIDGYNFFFVVGLFDGFEVSGLIVVEFMNDNMFYFEGKG